MWKYKTKLDKKDLFPFLGPGRGYSWELLVGLCGPVLEILTRFQTKKYTDFPHPFSDQTCKIHTRFQTWPLGRNYFVITYIRAQTNKFIKSISNSHISLSFLLLNLELIRKNTLIHTRSSPENHTRFQTKMGKVYTCF